MPVHHYICDTGTEIDDGIFRSIADDASEPAAGDAGRCTWRTGSPDGALAVPDVGCRGSAALSAASHACDSWPARSWLHHDFQCLSNHPVASCSAAPMGNDMLHWQVTIFVQLDARPLEQGRVVFLDIIFPLDYPVQPPQVQFAVEVFHPSVHPDGAPPRIPGQPLEPVVDGR